MAAGRMREGFKVPPGEERGCRDPRDATGKGAGLEPEARAERERSMASS